VYAVMRSTRKTPRHSGRKAKKWSGNRSNSPDRSDEQEQETRHYLVQSAGPLPPKFLLKNDGMIVQACGNARVTGKPDVIL
jgi:hypothetical protein